ncbi:MAG: hypothetical protein ABI881_14365 [Betaproteobacteria bacterium]
MAGSAWAGGGVLAGALTSAPTLLGGTMSFPAQPVNAASAPQTETLTAHIVAVPGPIPPGTALQIAGTSIDNADFAVTGGTCTPIFFLADGAGCTLQLTFTPSVAGPRTAQLSVQCALTSVVGVVALVCDNVMRPLIQLSGFGNALVAAVATAVPTLGAGPLTALALLLFGASIVLMRRRR